jgi:hypothetical protein
MRMLQLVYLHGPGLEGVAGAFLGLAREFRDQHRRARRAKSATRQSDPAVPGSSVNIH